MQQQTIGLFICDVDEHLTGFIFQDFKSSAIEYAAYKADTGKLFLQFKSGKSYVYAGVELKVLLAAIRAESFTGAITSAVSNCQFVKYDQRLVTIANV